MQAVLKAMAAVSIVLLTTLAFGVAQAVSSTSVPIDDGSSLVGNWTGESICTGAFPSCHDEKVIYRIPQAPDESGKVTITADKIVDGKPETMGVLDFKYDRDKGTLICDFTRGNTHGVWEFTVKQDTMEGTLIVLPAKTLARRVKLKKDDSIPPASVTVP
jgi:hypothetical protein